MRYALWLGLSVVAGGKLPRPKPQSPGESRILNPKTITSSVYDVAIIGGGPAGGALAAELASSGRRVVLCERERVPRGKLCGEFLSGEACGYLAHLGCLEEVLEAGAVEIARARFTAPSGRVVEIVLPRTALGLSRKGLKNKISRYGLAPQQN